MCITAREVLEIANSRNTSLVDILSLIREKAMEGKTNLELNFRLHKIILHELGFLGYKITYRDGSTLIDWSFNE